jgi:hypothetical protein
MDVDANCSSSVVASSELVAPEAVVGDAQVVVLATDDDAPGKLRAPTKPSKPTPAKALTATPAVSRSSFLRAALRARILLFSDIGCSCTYRTMRVLGECSL